MVKLMSNSEGTECKTADPEYAAGETMIENPAKRQKPKAESFYLLDWALRAKLQAPHTVHKFVKGFCRNQFTIHVVLKGIPHRQSTLGFIQTFGGDN